MTIVVVAKDDGWLSLLLMKKMKRIRKHTKR